MERKYLVSCVKEKGQTMEKFDDRPTTLSAQWDPSWIVLPSGKSAPSD
jgi:hypothetical protein